MRAGANAFLILAFLAAGCGAPDTTSDTTGTWVGTITAEGNLTTVINESGSVWGGTARLVEEASIGVERGDDPYLFGQVRSVAATENRIIVADPQVPIVRVYDFEGNYLRDLGRAGDGPGEYRFPASVRTHDRDRVFIRDDGRYLVHLYDLDGAHIETWDTQHRVNSFTQVIVTGDGRLITWVSVPAENDAERRSGMQAFDAEGPLGPLIVPPTFDFERILVSAVDASGSSMRSGFPPQYPNVHWRLDAAERMIAGVSTEYRFEIRLPGGATMIVENRYDPVPIPAQERSDARIRLTNWAREADPTWTWNVPPIPDYKPPFSGFVSAGSGDVWVLRPMASRRIEDCVEDTPSWVGCWQQDVAYDVFEHGGRFLGDVAAPRGLIPYVDPHIDGDVFVGVIEDQDGIQYVKRYRLVLPGER